MLNLSVSIDLYTSRRESGVIIKVPCAAVVEARSSTNAVVTRCDPKGWCRGGGRACNAVALGVRFVEVRGTCTRCRRDAPKRVVDVCCGHVKPRGGLRWRRRRVTMLREYSLFDVATPNRLARQSWEIARESASVVYRPFIRRTAAGWGRVLVSPAGPWLGLVTRLPARCCMLFGGRHALNGVIRLPVGVARGRIVLRWGRCVLSQMLTRRRRVGPVAFETTPSGASFADC